MNIDMEILDDAEAVKEQLSMLDPSVPSQGIQLLIQALDLEYEMGQGFDNKAHFVNNKTARGLVNDLGMVLRRMHRVKVSTIEMLIQSYPNLEAHYQLAQAGADDAASRKKQTRIDWLRGFGTSREKHERLCLPPELVAAGS